MIDERWVEIANGRLFVKCWIPEGSEGRDGPPIVLLHDSLGCVALWREFPERLSQVTGRSVIAYDRLGFGRSDPYPGELPLSFVEDEAQGGFAAVCEQLGLERFVVFGHSVGGGMAAGCAAAFPEQCRALITESAQAFVEDRTLEGIRQAQRQFAQEGQVERLEKYHGDKAEWVLSAWIDTWLSGRFRRWCLDETLRRVRCPVLAMHGDHDEYGSVRHPERIVSLARGPAAVEVLPGCGHVPHREEEAAVLRAVKTFLA